MYKGKIQFRLANIYFLLQSQCHLDQGRKLCQNSYPVHAQASAWVRIFTECYFMRTGGVCATSLEIPEWKVSTRSFCQKRTFHKSMRYLWAIPWTSWRPLFTRSAVVIAAWRHAGSPETGCSREKRSEKLLLKGQWGGRMQGSCCFKYITIKHRIILQKQHQKASAVDFHEQKAFQMNRAPAIQCQCACILPHQETHYYSHG